MEQVFTEPAEWGSFGKMEAVHAVGMHGFEDLRQELRELEL